MCKLVLIGGTGRCGTNVLKDLLSVHSQVASLPFEHRFFIDPDGILDFYSSYSQFWSPFVADRRVKRLSDLLGRVGRARGGQKVGKRLLKFFDKKHRFISPPSYTDWELHKHFPNFEKHNKTLVERLTEFEFSAVWPGTKGWSFRPKLVHAPPKSREHLQVMLRKYTQDLLLDFCHSAGRTCFVEDNTWNILFAHQWSEIMPDAKLIHIIRDPRDVVASFMKQRWCPSDFHQAVQWYKALMENWFSIRDKLPQGFFLEVKLEDLVTEAEKTIASICKFTGLPFEEKLLDFDLSHSNSGRWKKDFSDSEKKDIDEALVEILNLLGYNRFT